MANGDLRRRVKLEIEQHGSINRLSKATGVNPGVIHRVKNGGNSPTLRRLWKIPKNEPVPRLIINNCPPEIKAQFEAQRGELSRVEHLVNLMRRDYGELEY